MEILRIGTGPSRTPVLATAIHDGHIVRPEVADRFALDPEERRREEDPHTGTLASAAPAYVVGLRSRFEFDLNRPREAAVYRSPEDAWGLDVWKSEPSEEFVRRSLRSYDRAYTLIRAVVDCLLWDHESIVVLDLHSYNHRRDGPAAPAAPQEWNPDVNVGTGSLDHGRWRAVVDRFLEVAGSAGIDARENVRFRGGHLSRWLHATYPGRVCCLAVEFKKVFMDEWTGQVDPERVEELRSLVAASVDPLASALSLCAASA
ncbi:MAG: N-formylglutamate amidohydrolase [Planctomycetota bacterium]|jgi:N-formylglutamate amidohydrolase